MTHLIWGSKRLCFSRFQPEEREVGIPTGINSAMAGNSAVWRFWSTWLRKASLRSPLRHGGPSGEHVSGAAYLVYVAVPVTLALIAFGDPVDDGIVNATDPEIVLPTCPKSVTEIVIESPVTV